MPRRIGRESHWWHGKFRGCGFRITLGREAILNILTKAHKHLSAEDIYLKIHPQHPSIGLTTVYRTLDMLVNMGLIYKYDFGDRRARYELAEGPRKEDHHHHLVCTECNRVINYKDFIEEEIEFLKMTEKELSKKYKFNITNHLIQFYGICEKCKKRK